MTTQEIGSRLFKLCQLGQFETAQKELYAENATSTESNMQGGRITVTGMDAIVAKGKSFMAMIEEMFGGNTNEPKVYGNYIFMEMSMDVKMKGMDRMNMVEMCCYEVKDGKIVSEEFYY